MSGGNLGIGTTNPLYRLEVVGNAYVSSNLSVGTANLHVDTTTGFVGIGTDTPAYALDVTGDARISGTQHITDYSRDISQNYFVNFDGLSATDEELCLFEVNPSLGGFSWIVGEIEVEIMSKRGQTFMHFSNQKVKIKFNFQWDARGGTGGWRNMTCFLDHTLYPYSGGSFIQYPVKVFYKYKGTRVSPEIEPKLQVYLKYSGGNFVGYFSVKGHYNSDDFNSFNPTFPSSVFTTDVDTTDIQANVYTANRFDYPQGNLGIGTVSPGYKLDVHGTSNVGALTATSATINGTLSTTSDVSLGVMAGHETEGTLKFARADGTDRVHNIKVYNSSTRASNYMKFQIHAGGASAGALTDNVLYLRGDGNVGIGTDSPVTTLDVDGIGWVRGDLQLGAASSGWPYYVKKFTSGVNLQTLTLEFSLNFLYRGGIVKAWLTSGVSGEATVATWSRKVSAFSWRNTSVLAETVIEDEEQHSDNSITITMPSNGTLRVTGTMYTSFSYPMMEVEVTYPGGVR